MGPSKVDGGTQAQQVGRTAPTEEVGGIPGQTGRKGRESDKSITAVGQNDGDGRGRSDMDITGATRDHGNRTGRENFGRGYRKSKAASRFSDVHLILEEMKQKKKIVKSVLKDKKVPKEIVEIFPGLYEMPDGSILNTKCEVQVPYARKYDPLQLLHNFMNQVN